MLTQTDEKSTTETTELQEKFAHLNSAIFEKLAAKYADAPETLLRWTAADLAGSAIAPKIALDNFIPIWDSEAIAEFLGWKSYSGDPGWICGGQFKPMKPIAFPDGKTAKYLTSKNGYDAASLKGVDWKAIADDPTEPIYITEGAKKAAALISQRLSAISLPGVDMGHRPGKRGVELVSTLKKFAQPGRPVVLTFDADILEKKEVAAALLNLGSTFKSKGCLLTVGSWDISLGKGIDDVISNGALDKVERKTFKEFTAGIEKQFTEKFEKQAEKKPSEFARELAEQYRDRLAWSPNGSAWFTYADGLWTEAYPEQVQAIAQDYLECGDYEYVTVAPIVDALKAKLLVIDWERNSHLIPFKNGVFDIRENKLKPHAPGNRLLWQLPHNYEPGGIDQWPTIRNFLIEAFAENYITINTVCCAIAAGLRGMSDVHKFIEFTGPGGTGKSTLMSLIRQVAGTQNVWDGHIEDMNDKHAIIELREKRFAIHDDQDPVSSRSLGNFKRATGGGNLTGRGLYKNACSFKATAIHLITTNQSLFHGIESHGDWQARRRITIECKVKPNNPQPDLQEKFALEIGAFTAYLLSIPDAEIYSTLSSSAESNHLSPAFWQSKLEESIPDWMDTHLIYAPGAITKIGSNCDEWSATNYDPYLSTLFGSYYAHGRGNGHKQLANKQNFSKVVLSLCDQLKWDVEKVHTSGGAVLKNVRLRTRDDADVPTILDTLRSQATHLEQKLTEKSDHPNGQNDDPNGQNDHLNGQNDHLNGQNDHLNGDLKPLPSGDSSQIQQKNDDLGSEISKKNLGEKDFSGDIRRQTIWKTTELIDTLIYEKKVPKDYIKREIQRWYQVRARSQMTLDQLNNLVAALETWAAEMILPYGEWAGHWFEVSPEAKAKQSSNKRMKGDRYPATEDPTVMPSGHLSITLGGRSVKVEDIVLVK